MGQSPTVGMRLRALKERSGLSLAEIAKRSGYQGASSIQKLFKEDYSPDQLAKSVAYKLAQAFVGQGDPPILEEELLSLAGESDGISQTLSELSYYRYQASAYIGLYRTKRLNEVIETDGGALVPLFARDELRDGVSYFPAPKHLRTRSIIGLYVTIGNMWPRYEEGETIFYEVGAPPRAGDDVVVRLISEQELDGGLIIGRLVLLHEEEVQIDQFSPKARLVFPRRDVIEVYRLLQPADLLPPLEYAKVVD